MSTSIKAQSAGFNPGVSSTLADELDLDFAASGSEADDHDDDGDRDEEAEAANGARDDNDAEDKTTQTGPLNDERWRELDEVLALIQRYQTQPQSQGRESLDNDPQYALISRSNAFSTSIDDHMTELHKRIRDIYHARFPELETLLPDPLEYTKTVAIIANGPMDALRTLASSADNPANRPLNTILSRPKLMTVTVEATTTRGQALSSDLLAQTLSHCSRMLHLEKAKHSIQTYVESRMQLFCPNLTALIGSHTAAQLLTARGGLNGLSCTRAANIPSIGSKRFAASGFATNTGIRNQGALYASPPIARLRPELKIQGMRIVSGKVVLAARIDLAQSSPDGTEGQNLLDQAERRLDKLTEPAPNKGQRALPAPDDKPSKRRGGRRARKAKEATAVTDLRKAQNRMAFGKEEAEVGYGVGDGGGNVGLGMIGAQDDGRVRTMKVDQRTRAKLSKKNPGWGGGGGATSTVAGGHGTSIKTGGTTHASTARQAQGVGALTNVGTASSLTFGQGKGLELVDPRARAEAEQKARVEKDRYFKGGSFTQVGGGGAGGGAGGKKDGENGAGGGFKKPALPMKRKAEDAA